MLDRAIGLFGLTLTLILGLWTFAPANWPKMPPWVTISGVGLGLILFGVGIGLIVADLRRDDPKHVDRWPELHLRLSGANVFIPDTKPDWTGIALDGHVWNTGTPTIITGWSMTIVPNGKDPAIAQLTAMPNVITATGPINSVKLIAENSLEKKTSASLVGASPINGILLFYVALPKSVVQAPDTRWEVSVKDLYEKETSVGQLVGDWLQR